MAALVLPIAAQTPGDDVERLTRENQQLREQIAALTAELETLRQEMASLQTDNVELTQEAESLEQQVIEQQTPVPPIRVVEDRAVSIQAQRIQSQYDAGQDQTTVRFGPEELEVAGSPGSFYFSIAYTHAGAEPRPANEATLFLQAYRAGRPFDRPDVVQFEVDGEPETLSVAGYELTPRKAGLSGRTRVDRSDEIVIFELTRDDLAWLGEARSLSATTGRAIIQFDEDDLAAMRAVAQRMSIEK